MMTQIKKTFLASLASIAILFSSASTNAEIPLTVPDSSAPWLGYMNVFELPSNGGGFVFGSPWGIPDLVATFNDPLVTMSPNTIGDPDPFWYIGGGGPGAQGNKIMEANLYIEETGPLSGDLVTFSGVVTDYSLTSAHVAQVFIRDFAPDYSSSVDTFASISSTGEFSISLNTIADASRHVQYGFQLKGENVWETDVDPFGSVTYGPTAVGPNCPTAFTLLNGVEQAGTDFANSCDADDVWWGLQSTTFAAAFSPPAIEVELDGFIPIDGGSNLTFTVEGHPTLGSNNVFITVALFNYSTGLYEQQVFSGQPNGPPDAVYSVTKDNTNGDYVGEGGAVKARVTCSKTTTGPTRLFIDSMYWE